MQTNFPLKTVIDKTLDSALILVLRTSINAVMELIKALSLSIGESEEPVITSYRLGVLVHRLYVTKRYKDHTLSRLAKDFVSSTEFQKVLGKLLSNGVLSSHPDFHGRVFGILGRKTENVSEVACTVDPFCYLSHLSAMRHHGLTNRLPHKLFISSPNHSQWRTEAYNQMRKDLEEEMDVYLDGNMPPLTRPVMRKIDRVEIHRFSSVHWGAFRNVRGKQLRVATIGRTFLDMLRSPKLCGGMNHVLDVWESEAKQCLKPIINEIDQNGKSIDKVRAGYLLEEKLGIKNGTVETWSKFAERGGSRKLDAAEEYAPHWSEKWCLSLNI